jgi:hypothetical protein
MLQPAAAPKAECDVAGASIAAAGLPGFAGLDDLAALTVGELADVYRAATTPALCDLTGDLRGRMLAIHGLSPAGRIARWLHRLAASRWFPWRGKSFTAGAADLSTGDSPRGAGINRVFSDTRPQRWFRFETSIGPSRADGGRALHLDYDNRDNPSFIRAIADEVRQVAPGLFLGQAYLVRRKRARLVLYFALAARG